MVLQETYSMSRREKRIEALRGQYPTLTDEQLRQKEKRLFHKQGGGGGKHPHAKNQSSPKKRLVAAR